MRVKTTRREQKQAKELLGGKPRSGETNHKRMRHPEQLVQFIITEELVPSMKPTHVQSKIITMALVHQGDDKAEQNTLILMVPCLM